MSTLIPAINSCIARMTQGEKRFAERLEQKLEDDYNCWYDVAIGQGTTHPDFVICHPGRGLLVLEVKDWLTSTLVSMDKERATLQTHDGEVKKRNPLEQARYHMHTIKTLLQRDTQLTFSGGRRQGDVMFPLACGVVLTNFTRNQFDKAGLANVLPAHLVICKDEMTENTDAETFQERLWQMFPYHMRSSISLPQIDRIRWHMFPEIRVPAQQDLFKDSENVEEIPDILRIMDIQQEQLARSLGNGHRIIHGVAGSGKTMILGYRAEHLAQVTTRPILILCFNSVLAASLETRMYQKGLTEKINVMTFHSWCISQLKAFGIPLPKRESAEQYCRDCVELVISSVDRQQIPRGQYDAILIDEGHDFEPAWFKLIVQMIHPDSNTLLVLYDDAQSIYKHSKKIKSFASVGIQARGRTTILHLNYRNTIEILAVAKAFAQNLLHEQQCDDDQIPVLEPMGAGRHGPEPLLIELPNIPDEANHIANIIIEQNQAGRPWQDIAVICRHRGIQTQIEQTCRRRHIPCLEQKSHQGIDAVHLLTMHSSKGLEFPLVCIPAVGAAFKHAGSQEEEAQLLYVAMTRATRQLIMTYGSDSCFAEKLRNILGSSQQKPAQ